MVFRHIFNQECISCLTRKDLPILPVFIIGDHDIPLVGNLAVIRICIDFECCAVARKNRYLCITGGPHAKTVFHTDFTVFFKYIAIFIHDTESIPSTFGQ